MLIKKFDIKGKYLYFYSATTLVSGSTQIEENILMKWSGTLKDASGVARRIQGKSQFHFLWK